MTDSLYINYLSLYLLCRDNLDRLLELLSFIGAVNREESLRQITLTESDRQIIELLNRDKERGFRMLYDHYYKPLTIYAIRLTDSQAVAEDVVQDLLISIWERSLWCNVKSNLRSYLFLSVRNNALAQLRKNGNKSIEELSSIHCEMPDDDYDALEMENKRIKIDRELMRLPQREYEAVQKVILEDKKYIDAAKELNISINTLKTHLSRATVKLRNQDLL